MLWSLLIATALATAPSDRLALKHIQPIEIKQPFEYSWTAEKPAINKATILVLEIEPEKVGLPQVGAPVLYVGPIPAA